MTDSLIIAGRSFSSRLFAGTGKFSSSETMQACLKASGTELVTVALKRVRLADDRDSILDYLDQERYLLMPNTSGARTAEEAVMAARLGREALGTNWVKVEIHPDPKYLMPDPIETLKASYTGVLPDLFFNPHSELILEGSYGTNQVFHADSILVKCPSKYIDLEDETNSAQNAT